MVRKMRYFNIFLIIVLTVFLLSSCAAAPGDSNGSTGSRTSSGEFPMPEAAGQVTLENQDVSIDASNTSEGYIMVKYTGTADKAKIQITGPDSNEYTYTYNSDSYETFPLTAGSGSYLIKVLENTGGDMYAMCMAEMLEVNIDNEFSPFLYPNQYVWFTPDSEAVKLGRKLSEASDSDLNFVERVYEYTTSNISYDKDKARDIPVDYIPDIDETLANGRGICFDYASLMSALLRSEGIPARLEVGYAGTAYHAWISVYTDETGWVDNAIQFNGESWSLMDPTLAASNDSDSVKEYVGDGTNYLVKYNY